MILASLVLIISAAFCLFYFQVLCQRTLRREFEQPYFQAIVNANRLEFMRWRKALEENGSPVDYAGMRQALRCDFQALTYLLKAAANIRLRYSAEERLLILYARLAFLSLALLHTLRLDEKPEVLKLTSVLQYFANVVGRRVSVVRFGNMSSTEYLY